MISSVLLGLFGGQEVLVILIIVILLFGAKKIPQLMKGIGSGIREFKEGVKGEGEKPGEGKV